MEKKWDSIFHNFSEYVGWSIEKIKTAVFNDLFISFLQLDNFLF